MLTSRDFANVLRKLDRPTLQTNEFEDERDETSERKYAQKKDRWWDKSTGTQKEHLVCWFARKFYSEDNTKQCIENNLTENCKECYFEKNRDMGKWKQKIKIQNEAKNIFNRMQRPEMYLWIAEALDVIEEEKLKECILELKGKIKKEPKKWKVVIKEYIVWEMIENKINNQ